jgi:cbb3-type cytochrome oxidase subunit 3
MNATLISLLAVTVGTLFLILWILWPGQAERFRAHARIPLEDGHDDSTSAEELSR